MEWAVYVVNTGGCEAFNVITFTCCSAQTVSVLIYEICSTMLLVYDLIVFCFAF